MVSSGSTSRHIIILPSSGVTDPLFISFCVASNFCHFRKRAFIFSSYSPCNLRIRTLYSVMFKPCFSSRFAKPLYKSEVLLNSHPARIAGSLLTENSGRRFLIVVPDLHLEPGVPGFYRQFLRPSARRQIQQTALVLSVAFEVHVFAACADLPNCWCHLVDGIIVVVYLPGVVFFIRGRMFRCGGTGVPFAIPFTAGYRLS